MNTLEARWDDWVQRRATVTVKKDPAEDAPNVTFELLRSRLRMVPALVPEVVIADPVLDMTLSYGTNLAFKPVTVWPIPNTWGARLREDTPDVLWAIQRQLTVDDFA